MKILSEEKRKALETLDFNFQPISNPYRKGDKVRMLNWWSGLITRSKVKNTKDCKL